MADLDLTTLTTRERVATLLNNHPDLLALGLPTDAVIQADTADSPTFRPFIVIRWLDVAQRMGPVSVRPFELWGYDTEGDYTRIERILVKAAEILTGESSVPMQTTSGCISQIKDDTLGYGRGSDLYDEGYKAVVIPWRLQAVATGL